MLYLANISRRLASEGVETGAVLTSSFTRRVQHGSGAGRHRSRAIRHEDVGYFSYAYDVGGESYEGEVRRSGPLVRARVGDSVRVRYLPDAPARHTLVRDGEGNVRFRGVRAPGRAVAPGGMTSRRAKNPRRNANFLHSACRVNFFSYLCAPAMCGKGLQQVKFKRKTQWIH